MHASIYPCIHLIDPSIHLIHPCIHFIDLPNHYLRDSQCWSSASPQTVSPDLTWDFTIEFIANNFDFPVFLLKDTDRVMNHLPFQQLRAYLTGETTCIYSL